MEDIKEVYELLLVLEPLAARRAANRMTKEQIAELRALHEEMTATEDVAEWVQLNRRFHTLMHEAADSPRLVGILNSLRDASTPQVALAVNAGLELGQSNAEHGKLVKALQRGNAERVADVMTRHLAGTLEFFRARAGSPL